MGSSALSSITLNTFTAFVYSTRLTAILTSILVYSLMCALTFYCHFNFLLNIGSPDTVRTCDQQINSLLLYRLSYWGMIDMAESLGVEPSDRITTVYGLAIRCITVLPALDNLLSRHSSLLQKSGGPSRDRTGD